MILTCDNCKKRFEIKDNFKGIVICPFCRTEYFFGPKLIIECPECGGKIRVFDISGLKLKCPHCGEKLIYIKPNKIISKSKLSDHYYTANIIFIILALISFLPGLKPLIMFVLFTLPVVNLAIYFSHLTYKPIIKRFMGKKHITYYEEKLERENKVKNEINKIPELCVISLYFATIETRLNEFELDYIYDSCENMLYAFYKTKPIIKKYQLNKIAKYFENYPEIAKNIFYEHLQRFKDIFLRAPLLARYLFFTFLRELMFYDSKITNKKIYLFNDIINYLDPDNTISLLFEYSDFYSNYDYSFNSEYNGTNYSGYYSKSDTNAKSTMTREQALEFFGLPYDSSCEDIKKRYRELVKQYHPDYATSETDRKQKESMFKKLQEAYKVLKEDCYKRGVRI